MKIHPLALASITVAATVTSFTSAASASAVEKKPADANGNGAEAENPVGLALRGRRLAKSGKSDVAPDYSWILGTYDTCTRTTVSLNEGISPPRGIIEDEPCRVGENLTIALLNGTTSGRILQANYTNPGIPCVSFNLTDDECPQTYPLNSPFYGNQTTTIRYEMEGVGSYAPQQADQLSFNTDYFQFLKVVDGELVWITSFTEFDEDIDILTCFKMSDERQLVCDGQYQDNSVLDFAGVPGIYGPHFQNLGSWLWTESETE